MGEVRVVGIRVEQPQNQPVLLLRESNGDRYLPIWIGQSEANAIALEQQGVEPARPMTHDLLIDLLGALGASLTQVVVTEVVESTFFAELHLDRDGATITLSSRPSDAIAIALRADAPIYVATELMDAVGVIMVEAASDDDEPDNDLVDAFREFLDSIDPDDFQAS